MGTSRLKHPPVLIDRPAVIRRLEDGAAAAGDPRDRRQVLLPVLHDAFDRGRADIQGRFLDGRSSGVMTFAENASLTDEIVRLVFDYAITWAYPRANRTEGERLSVLAVGGYGRGEMSPFSDIDLLFLLPYRATPLHEQIVEFALYTFWDMKLKVGHATRSIDDCIRLARQDTTICTALLESRFVWGEESLGVQLEKRFADEIVAGGGADFIEAKLIERDERHKRMGDTRYFLEPNIKDGKGGLRDLQTLFWIARFIYGVSDMTDLVDRDVLTTSAARKFTRARNFLWTVRCHLHYLTGRPEERLTFDVQTEIARRMGYSDHPGARGVERFMKHYFLMAKTVGDFTRIFCAVLENQQKRRPRLSLTRFLTKRRLISGFRVDEFGRLAVDRPDAFDQEPLALMRLFKVAHDHGLDIHPDTLRLITESLPLVVSLRGSPQANALFLDILTSKSDPEITLRQMSESGVLGRFLPEFAKVIAQMQFDMYHVYTTDEHTLRAVGLLHQVENEALRDVMPLAVREFRNIHSRRALYVAVLLHDIAKGQGGDHSVVGAEIALRVGPRLGLTDEETETASWLVRHHLLMSRTAFNRDLENPKTIQDFCTEIQSMERLRLLLILTTVDILAVGPTVWNNWKASLLRELFRATEEALTGDFQDLGRNERVKVRRTAVAQALTDWTDEDRNAYLDGHYPAYWLAFDSLEHIRHARIIQRARASGDPVSVEIIADHQRNVSEVVIYAPDQPGLFSRIAGALALAGVSILEARILTMVDGMALDVFTVQTLDGEAVDVPARTEKLTKTVIDVVSGTLDPTEALLACRLQLPERTLALPVSPRVLIDNQASKTHTVIEVNGRDRRGFLFAVTQALADLGVHIFSARINTYGERVVDVFYVKDNFGLKIDHPGRLAQIRETLMGVISDTPKPVASS